MKRLLVAAALVSGTAQAQNFGTETRLFAYWQMPIGAETPAAGTPSMGLQFRAGPSAPMQAQAPFKSAIVELRFGSQGFQSFSLNGVVLRQNQAPDSPPVAETNWWIVGAVAVGATAIIHRENKRDKQQVQQQAKPCTIVFTGIPPVSSCI